MDIKFAFDIGDTVRIEALGEQGIVTALFVEGAARERKYYVQRMDGGNYWSESLLVRAV